MCAVLSYALGKIISEGMPIWLTTVNSIDLNLNPIIVLLLADEPQMLDSLPHVGITRHWRGDLLMQ